MATIVVDLSYLTASSPPDVQAALRGHTILITFELIYEMTTNSLGKNAREYLDKLVGLDVVQSRSLVSLVNQEIREGRRTEDVADRPATDALVEFVRSGQGIGVTADVAEEVRGFYEESEPRRLRNGLDLMWDARFDPIFARVKPAGIAADARNYLSLMNTPGHSILGRALAGQHGMTREPAPGWLIYEWERLRNFLAFRLRLNATRSDTLNVRNLANNLADLHYLAFLPHVEAIATNDTKLIVPLAREFGPVGLQIIRPPRS